MNDANLPKPTPPAQPVAKPLSPGVAISPGGDVSAKTSAPVTPSIPMPSAPTPVAAPAPAVPKPTPVVPAPAPVAPAAAPNAAVAPAPMVSQPPAAVQNSQQPAPKLPAAPAPMAESPLSHLPPSPLRPNPSGAPVAATPPQAVTALSSASPNKIPTTPLSTIRETQLPTQAPGTAGAPASTGAKPMTSIPVASIAPGGSPAAGGPKVAEVKKPIMKFVPFIVLGLIILGVVGMLLARVFGGTKSQPVAPDSEPTSSTAPGTQGGRQAVPAKEVTLKYWGLWESSAVLSEVFADFEKANPGVKIEYSQQSHKDYRERLQTAVAGGQGPDLFRFHASWTPMLRSELAVVPSSVMTVADMKSDFYPAANTQLQLNGQIVGVPLMYDGLALLYNKDIFDSSGVTPPKTWAELRTLANKLTVKPAGQIQRGGIALGETANVESYADILGLLLLQNGATLSTPNSPETRDALLFFANFAKTEPVWNKTLPMSSVAFARGDVAMIFAPSWRIHEVLAMNPSIKIGVAPVPKLSDTRIGWASYWAEGISAQSQNKTEAGALLKYLASPEVLRKLYASASKARQFGEPYPRVSMASELANDPFVGPYLSDAPYSQGWYLSQYTHDKGINDQIIKYYEDALNALALGKPIDDVVETVDQGVPQVLRQYSAK